MLDKIILFVAMCGLFCTAATAQSDTITATYSGSINSGYTGTFGSGGCLYTLPVVIPPEFTVTDIARHFGLQERALFHTLIQSLRWDEGIKRWRIAT